MPSSKESSQPKDQTQVSCIAGWFFAVWVTREATFSNISCDNNKSDALNVICFIYLFIFSIYFY